MIKLLILFLIVLALVYMPLHALDQQVMPELMGLKEVYGNAEATAQQVLQK
jgi:hypothetical protein